MKLVTIKYERTEFHRISTCGGMDSEYSHSIVETREMSIVVPGEGYVDQALALCDEFGGHAHDKSYRRLEHAISDVHAIISAPRFRLD